MSTSTQHVKKTGILMSKTNPISTSTDIHLKPILPHHIQTRFYSNFSITKIPETIVELSRIPDELKSELISKVIQPFKENQQKGISHGGRSVEKHSQIRDIIFDKDEILAKTEGRTETEKFNNYAKKVIQEILDSPKSQARIRYNARARGDRSVTLLEIGVPKDIGSRYDIEFSEVASFEIFLKNTEDSQKIDVIRFCGFITNFKPSDEAIRR